MRWKSCCNHSSCVGRGVALAGAAAVCLFIGCRFPELTRVSSDSFPHPDACSKCHVDIYNEWKQSPHSGAFTNPRFRAATDGYRFERCLGCHAPEPGMATGEPQARQVARQLGVTCVTCHLDHGAMVGPLPPTGFARPHPITVNPTPFEAGRLCGHCHQGTLAQWQAAEHKPSGDCRDCHMPAVERKITQVTDAISNVFVAAEKPAHEHRHSFTMIPLDLPEKAFTLDVDRVDRQAVVTLTNLQPHNLPTGDFGVRIVEVLLEAIAIGGEVRVLSREELTSAGGYLASGRSRQWAASIPAEARTLRARVVRIGRDGANRSVLLEREVALP